MLNREIPKEYLIGFAALALFVGFAFSMTRRESTSQQVTNPTPTESVEGDNNAVGYTNSGYTPSELAITAGATVTFINRSDLPMWTASDPHPLHTDYADFDHSRGVEKGETYEFTFTESGTYEYHNHLSPQHTGKIIVE